MEAKALRRSTQYNLLEGPLLPKVIRFILPLMLTNLLQVCYNAADMIIVGLSNVDGAIGAIGTTAAMINLILNVFMGFSVGAGVVVARNIGKGDRIATKKAVHTALIIALVSGLVCCVIGFFISRPILQLLGDEGHILDLATIYTKYYFAGVPFLALANYTIAILRATGDTKTPLYILSFTGILNVGLNLFFVVMCNMSVEGVALATLIANAISMVLLLIRLHNDDGWIRFDVADLGVDKEALGEIVRVGLPSGIQGALFSLSNMIIQSSIIGINNAVCPGGSDIIDGNAASSSIEGFGYVAVNSVTQAAITFTSQHYGAKKYRRIGRVMLCCYAVTFTVASICAAIIVGFRVPLASLYVSSPLALETASLRTLIMITPYFTLAFMDTGSGIMRGLGKSLTSTIISLTGSCMLRIVWIATIFRMFPTLEIVYLSYPISWAVTAATHMTVALLTRRKLIRQQDAELAAQDNLATA